MLRISPPVLLISLIFACGCSSPTAPSNGTPQWGALNTISGLRVTTHGDSIYGKAVAQFWDGTKSSDSIKLVSAVTVNGLALTYNNALPAYAVDNISIYSDSLFKWHVDGGTQGVDSFDTSGYRPANLRVYAPKPTDTVVGSDGFQVAWSGSVANSKVSIEVDDAHGHADQILSVDDIGSKMIAPDLLPNTRSGKITVYVYRTNIVSKVINGKGYVLNLGTQSSVVLNLK